MSEIATTKIEVPISADNLPQGPWWEVDGACWEAILCNPQTEGCEWRWAARNEKAIAKCCPEGEMTDHYPPRSLATKGQEG